MDVCPEGGYGGESRTAQALAVGAGRGVRQRQPRVQSAGLLAPAVSRDPAHRSNWRRSGSAVPSSRTPHPNRVAAEVADAILAHVIDTVHTAPLPPNRDVC